LARLLERVDAVVSVVIGLLNGTVIAALDLPPILVTLALLSIVRASALLLGGPDMHSIRGQPAYSFIGTGNILGIPFSVYLFAGLAALMLIIQKRTTFGLMVAALGDNGRAAFLSGHSTLRTKATLYALSGLCAALAGVIQSSQVHTGSATYGEFGIELDVIAAVVLGGTSLMGGQGSVARTLLGVMFLGVMNNGMNILDVPIDVQLIAKGVIIAVALALSEYRLGHVAHYQEQASSLRVCTAPICGGMYSSLFVTSRLASPQAVNLPHENSLGGHRAIACSTCEGLLCADGARRADRL
jgi:ribose/xylose/arabinose/galactoside ABC-type transport system permease subunit